MTENLRLELSTTKSLTNSDTDLNSRSTWTPANSTSVDDNTPWGTGTAWNDNSSITAQEINTQHSYSGKQEVILIDLDNEQQMIGNYYNWAAATAGSGVYSLASGKAPDSVCPAGWHLPPASGSQSWNGLLSSAYGLRNDTVSVELFQKKPLSFIFSGRYEWFTGRKTQEGTYGIWWSESAHNNFNAYRLHANSLPNLSLGGSDIKASGFTIRCVAR